jgi:hypothetical protein
MPAGGGVVSTVTKVLLGQSWTTCAPAALDGPGLLSSEFRDDPQTEGTRRTAHVEDIQAETSKALLAHTYGLACIASSSHPLLRIGHTASCSLRLAVRRVVLDPMPAIVDQPPLAAGRDGRAAIDVCPQRSTTPRPWARFSWHWRQSATVGKQAVP